MELVAALGGAIVGALAVYVLHVKVEEPERTRQETRRLAAALLAEIEENKERYWKAFGEYLHTLQAGQPLERIAYIITTQDFFSVYDNNTDKLGLFSQPDIRTIVRAMTLWKGYVESINRAHRMISEFTTLMHESARASLMIPGHPIAELKAAAQNAEKMRGEAQVAMATGLQQESRDLMAAVDEAIVALKKYTEGHRWPKGERLPA